MKLAIAILSIALAGCGLGTETCDIPADEADIKRALTINLIAETLRSKRIIGTSASEYLEDNPSCCSVDDADFSFIDWLLWKQSSLPKYKARAEVAYRKGTTTFTYYNFGRGNSCGGLPDIFGEENIVEGPCPARVCPPTQQAPPNGRHVIVCETPERDAAPARAVPIKVARKLMLGRHQRLEIQQLEESQ
jgi:hypothetical protein